MSNYKLLAERTFELAVRIVKLCKLLDDSSGVPRNIASLLLQSGTAIGATIQELEFIENSDDCLQNLEIALKQGRDTKYWLRLLIATDLIPEERLLPLLAEINELIKIIADVVAKAQKNHQQ